LSKAQNGTLTAATMTRHLNPLRNRELEAPVSTALKSMPAPSTDPVSNFEGTSTDPTILQHPVGNKKAKLLNKITSKGQAWKDGVETAHRQIDSESNRLNGMFTNDSESLKCIAQNGTTQSQIAIMEKDLNGLNDEKKEFYKLKRKEVLKYLQSSLRSI
jgi:hypothetical protein